MKKQQIFAYACSAALLGTLIGCGQKTEIDQSVPDTIIEVAKTTASSETASVTLLPAARAVQPVPAARTPQQLPPFTMPEIRI